MLEGQSGVQKGSPRRAASQKSPECRVRVAETAMGGPAEGDRRRAVGGGEPCGLWVGMQVQAQRGYGCCFPETASSRAVGSGGAGCLEPETEGEGGKGGLLPATSTPTSLPHPRSRVIKAQGLWNCRSAPPGGPR